MKTVAFRKVTAEFAGVIAFHESRKDLITRTFRHLPAAKMTRVGLALSLGLVIAGCSTGHGPKDRSPIEEQAIKAAEEHLKAQGHLSEEYEVDVTSHEDKTLWVFFSFRPATPGGHCDDVVDKAGKVLRVYPGK